MKSKRGQRSTESLRQDKSAWASSCFLARPDLAIDLHSFNGSFSLLEMLQVEPVIALCVSMVHDNMLK